MSFENNFKELLIGFRMRFQKKEKKKSLPNPAVVSFLPLPYRGSAMIPARALGRARVEKDLGSA